MNGLDQLLRNFNDEADASRFTDSSKYKVYAVLAYICPILFFLPIVMDRNSDFCKFHSNQSLTWLLCTAVLGLIGGLLGWIPVLGSIIKFLLGIVWIAVTICFVYGIAKNYALRIPVIGNIVNLF